MPPDFTHTVSPCNKSELSRPVSVRLEPDFHRRSVLLMPVSLLNRTLVMAVVGAEVSNV